MSYFEMVKCMAEAMRHRSAVPNAYVPISQLIEALPDALKLILKEDIERQKEEHELMKMINAIKQTHKLIGLHNKINVTLRQLALGLIQREGKEGNLPIKCDIPSYRKFRIAYEDTLKENKGEFMFENKVIDIHYAYYLLVYLTPKIDHMGGLRYAQSREIRLPPEVTEDIVCDLPAETGVCLDASVISPPTMPSVTT